ncbi:hypothetical protein [Haladaptatus sp. AB643]|uniref:hypothetical protein n=1 Tax=Haladaptatus sp. AB643 TaxID=2934174 RepID=UPI00209C0A09|nr:hypothetical protein [Haladaptatus sp. AB643]MCO8244150.1 hypothetical protein [Haladaptatus sp. AB643]
MTDVSTPSTTDEYELLTAKQKEQVGNTETATVRRVHVSETHVCLLLEFGWTADPARVSYDLDDDGDVRNLEAVTAEHGFEFVQVGYLEELPLAVRYTDDEWVPTAHTVSSSGYGSLLEVVSVERVRTAVRRFVVRVRSITMEEFIVGVILTKKMLVVAILIWWLL